MLGGSSYKARVGWSWTRFFVSLTIVLAVASGVLWWQSGRFPYSPEEVRFRILMVQYVQTKNQLDQMYMHAGSSNLSQYKMDRKINRLCESFETFLVAYPD